METIDTDFKIRDSNYIAFLNGQKGLHETEAMFFKYLAAHNYNNLLLVDDLFTYPNRIKVLKLMNVDTIVVGTTGTYAAAFKKAFDEFKKLKYIPKTALVTMGSEAFWEYKKQVQILTLMPMHFSSDEPVIRNRG